MFQTYAIKNVLKLLKYSIQKYCIYISGSRILVDLDTKRHLVSRIRVDFLPYSEGGSMIPVDLQTTSMGGYMIQANPGSIFMGSI